MGLLKTYTDPDGDTLEIRVWGAPEGETSLSGYVSLKITDTHDGEYALHAASPKRARKIALAILAAADEAEGVEAPKACAVETVKVTTASGRVYEIDLAERRFRTFGDQDFAVLVFSRVIPADDPHHEWTGFRSLQVDDLGRLYIVEADGAWRQSTRIVEGLDVLLAALDAP